MGYRLPELWAIKRRIRGPKRRRAPLLRVRPWTMRRWRIVARKVPFLVDPVSMELVRFALPKRRTP
jgi:hypothetical protein